MHRERTSSGYSAVGKPGKINRWSLYVGSNDIDISYDWRAQEAALNKELPMFTCDIPVEGHGALNVHYVHQESTVAGAIPLLFVHGCVCYNA